ncbi:MAG TPA: permease-like cell division protein FtsX [Actinomycetota bacterium]
MAVKLEYAVQESVTNIRRNLFMSFAAVLVVAISLFLFGGVFLLRTAISRSLDIFTAGVRVTVFLDGDISPETRDELDAELKAMPEVASVLFEDKQQAYERFKELYADQPRLIENTRPDALPESFRIELVNPEQFAVIRDRFQGRVGVDDIRDERQVVNDIFAATRALRTAALAMAVIVGIAATVLIATMIRMAIYARRKEIGILKLVGATNWFIRVPFMMEGVVQGVVGSAVAALMLLAARPSLSKFSTPFEFFNVNVTYLDVASQTVWLVLAGVVVGGVGSIVGLRKFLDV